MEQYSLSAKNIIDIVFGKFFSP